MGESYNHYFSSSQPDSTSSYDMRGLHLDVHGTHGSSFPGMKKKGHGNRSWIKIDQNGNSKILELDKAKIMRQCSLPSRDLRLLDPLFIYPSTILGREKAIVVSLEQIRCIITSEEVILMNSLDRSVLQYKSELSKRLQTNKDQVGKIPSSYLTILMALDSISSPNRSVVRVLCLKNLLPK